MKSTINSILTILILVRSVKEATDEGIQEILGKRGDKE